MSYETLKVDFLKEGTIAKVTISRPKSMNAMNPKFFQEIDKVFTELDAKEDLRVAVLLSEGKVFTAGLDLKEAGNIFSFDFSQSDPARLSYRLYSLIRKWQGNLLKIVDCRVPVIAGMHSKVIGGGIDLSSMCDIRYCTSDTEFTIKQIDVGMAADIGTLQFMQNAVGSESTFRELAYTGRFFKAQEAKQIGFVTKILPNKEALDNQVLATAQLIASKSPVGIYALKQIMKRQFKKRTEDSLEYTARVNSSMLFTNDTRDAIIAFMQKKKAAFPKL